ncbi:TetR/AcrR family transcriptional regulator [Rhodobiaceae bacterium]|jgi:AcrR family transcriptional regulator|nr:TetR/AcrR family transcriptional regulator [Rhodobiaceae bacterium]
MKEQPNYKLSKKTDAVIEDISKNSNSWQRRKNSRPPEIIDAARKLLEEEGIKGLSMMNISKAAGVSEATVYKYFNDKNDLLNQVVNDWLEPFLEQFEKDANEITDLYSSLLFIAIRYLEGMKSTPKVHKIFFKELRFDKYVDSQMHESNKRYSNLLYNIIKKAKDEGSIRKDLNFSIFRDQFFGGLEHIGIRKILPGKPINIGQDAADLVNIIYSGISNK